MSLKEENEITIKITCSEVELIKYLESKGFKSGRKFTLDDYYLIPKKLKLDNITVREILSKAVIIRNINEGSKKINKIVVKNKKINEKGEILEQKAIGCEVLDYKDGIRLFEELGYYTIMNIKENDTIYFKDNIELAIKVIEEENILIEIETSNQFPTVKELKEMLNTLEISYEKSNYFVKKAEEELIKILKR